MGFTTREDGSYALGFMGSLLLGMWTFTGFDASAHVSEETRDPARRAPWGIVSSVVVSAAAGYALVLALTLAIRDLPKTAAAAHPTLFIHEGALGESWGRLALGSRVLAMWFCGLSALTSLSRATYAFARDGGLPGSKHLRAVGARFRTPHYAVVLAVAPSARPRVVERPAVRGPVPGGRVAGDDGPVRLVRGPDRARGGFALARWVAKARTVGTSDAPASPSRAARCFGR